MIKKFNITKKLAITFSTNLTRFNFSNFTLIQIDTYNFLDYNFNIVICNCMLRISYKNTKQQEALKKLYESMSELGNE